MVEILSVLLGLVIGPVEVRVGVDEAVSAVVLELDGRRVAELSGAPWKVEIDLGDELRPRRLSAVALDSEGREIARATRFLNVYRPPVGVQYILHRNSSGWVTMISLSWPERDEARVRRSAVSVDGSAVDFDDPAKIYPPPLDPTGLHVIEAVAEYSDGSVARDLIGVGGTVLGEGSARLTAMVVEVPDSAEKPTSATLAARVRDSGKAVRVVGVARGEAEIVFVRDAAAARAVERIAPGTASMGALSGARDAQAARAIHSLPIAPHEWVRLLDPGAPVRREHRLDAHRLSVPLVSGLEGDFGLVWHLKSRESDPAGRWLSDAVAIAGGRVAHGSRRRATVLLLAADSADEGSLLDPDGARGYLKALGVPLYVWYLGRPARAPEKWGATVPVRSVPAMEGALETLRADVARQRIVWVEGVHLAGEVEIETVSTPRSSAR